MVQAIEFPDLELMLTGHLRPRLEAWSARVDRRFPPANWTAGYAVVVRDDSGPDRSMITADRRVGFTCIGPEGSEHLVKQFAERVAAIVRAIPDVQTLPIATASVRGPYSLEANRRVEFYLTAELVVVGHSVTL